MPRMPWDVWPRIPAGPGGRSRVLLSISRRRGRAHTEPYPALGTEASSFTSTLPQLPVTSSLPLHCPSPTATFSPALSWRSGGASGCLGGGWSHRNEAGEHVAAPGMGTAWPTAPLSCCQECPGAGQPRAPSSGTPVCKLPLYHIITRCLGYQQISRRLGREGCGTIRKCQLAASSFCRSLNPIFLTCISATGPGTLRSDERRESRGENIAMETPQCLVPVPPDP